MKCPKCNNEMKMSVQITIHAPASFENNISKTTLRKKDIAIVAANWEKAKFWCSECLLRILK